MAQQKTTSQPAPASEARTRLLERLRVEQKIADRLDQLHSAGHVSDREIRKSEDRLDRLVRLLAEVD